jgi:hypothetical protein
VSYPTVCSVVAEFEEKLFEIPEPGGKYERQEEPNQIYERQDFCHVAS